jgi:hypothetical protein
MSKRTTYDKIYCPDVRARPRLPHGRDFTRGRLLPSALVKICLSGRSPASASCVRADASCIPSLPSPSHELPPLLRTQSSVYVDADVDAEARKK